MLLIGFVRRRHGRRWRVGLGRRSRHVSRGDFTFRGKSDFRRISVRLEEKFRFQNGEKKLQRSSYLFRTIRLFTAEIRWRAVERIGQLHHSFFDFGYFHIIQRLLNGVEGRSISRRGVQRFDRIAAVQRRRHRRTIGNERSFLFQPLLQFVDAMIQLIQFGLFGSEHFALIGDLSALLFVQFVSNLNETTSQ